ncbi:MAG: hypothetical protein DHS20C07_17780 [Methyloligella sp.]|nr:MAG: hypothetical protein DHS20C07_17780 [Methyloligella sp.]
MKKIHTPIPLGNLLFLLLAAVFLPSIAKAEIQEYLIRRMILLQTKCDLVDVKKEEPKQGGFKFQASCENVSFYPDGVIITCSDKDRETSCEIKTKIKKFENLNLLKNSVNQHHGDETEKKTTK